MKSHVLRATLIAVVQLLLLITFSGADKHPNVAIRSDGISRLSARSKVDDGDSSVAVDHWSGHVSTYLNRRQNDDDPEPSTHGPAVKMSGCFFCPEESALKLEGYKLLDFLTVAKMKSYMRGETTEIENKCVFYTRADDRPGGPKKLSKYAAQWACDRGRYSVWHLWPNKIMADFNSMYKDFYGIFLENNWLRSIADLRGNHPPRYILYFQSMSEAMAETCSGEVIVITQHPDDMQRFEEGYNIWKDKERPALQKRKLDGYVTNVVVVEVGTDKMWELDIDTLVRGKPVTQLRNGDFRVGLRTNGTEAQGSIEKREDLCDSSGVEQEPEDLDIFNGDYLSMTDR